MKKTSFQKEFCRHIVIVIAIFFILFLPLAFLIGKINPAEWIESEKNALFILWLVISIIVNFIYLFYKSDNNIKTDEKNAEKHFYEEPIKSDDLYNEILEQRSFIKGDINKPPKKPEPNFKPGPQNSGISDKNKREIIPKKPEKKPAVDIKESRWIPENVDKKNIKKNI